MREQTACNSDIHYDRLMDTAQCPEGVAVLLSFRQRGKSKVPSSGIGRPLGWRGAMIRKHWNVGAIAPVRFRGQSLNQDCVFALGRRQPRRSLIVFQVGRMELD